MHSIKTVRIKNDDMIEKKRSQKLKMIKERLKLSGIDFDTDKLGKIIVAPPCDIFRCVKTNDIVIKQGDF